MVIETARKLGGEIGKSEEWKKYNEARAALEKDKELLKTIGLLEQKKATIDQKLSNGQPVEVEDKRELKDLEEKLGESKVFADYIRAQSGYLGLMRRVDQAITEAMEKPEQGAKDV